MKKSIIALAALMTVSSAFAINNTFKFKVISSGPDIFPCNAGLMQKKTNNVDGYVVDTTNLDSYEYEQYVDSTTNTTPSGSYLPNKMVVWKTQFDEWTEEIIEGAPIGYIPSRSGEYVYARSEQDYRDLNKASLLSTGHKKNDVNTIISSLLFELSSENFGAKYFVDVCYYAPQFMGSTHNGVVSLKSKLSFSNLVSGRDYLERAGIKYDIQVYCDGDNTHKGVSSQDFTQNNQEITAINTNLVGSYSAVPNKCVLRYTFEETSQARRNHAAHGGVFTIFTDITEPVL